MASYLPGFEHDLFISYTHIDNEPLAHGKDGWVSTFHTALRARLRQLLGTELEIWRDAKLQGNDYLSDTLLKQFPKIAILVSILSPRYIRSEWCLKELQEFAHAAERTGGLRIDDKARICKVVKTLIPREQHPPELQGLLGYDFFDIDSHTGRHKEFLPELGKEEEYKFFRRLDDLRFLRLSTRLRGRSIVSPSTRTAKPSPPLRKIKPCDSGTCSGIIFIWHIAKTMSCGGISPRPHSFFGRWKRLI